MSIYTERLSDIESVFAAELEALAVGDTADKTTLWLAVCKKLKETDKAITNLYIQSVKQSE